MNRYLPLFPLNIVVFPGEHLNLHIFEPRYKQLIRECIAEDTTFGICTVLDDERTDYGTEIRVESVEKSYDGGEMDIRTRGVQAFKILDFYKQMPGKLYGGGQVEMLDDHDIEDNVIKIKLIDHLTELYRLVNPDKQQEFDESLLVYDIAHKVGLTPQQELELLLLDKEAERQLYLLNHLKNLIPILTQVEQLKERVRLNGHFRKLSLPDF